MCADKYLNPFHQYLSIVSLFHPASASGGIVCSNGGTANQISWGIWHCTCPEFFTGSSCEIRKLETCMIYSYTVLIFIS